MKDVESRIAQIAWFVLAGACRPAEVGSVSAPVASDTTVDVAAVDAGASIVMGEPDAAVAKSPRDARAICADYQSKAAAEPNGPRAQTPQLQRVYSPAAGDDVQGRRLDDAKVECRIVWERNKTTETVMVTPTCCPQSRMTTPCPPASPQQLPGERAKIEIAIVTNDATRVSSTLVWNQFVQEPPRHMCGRRPEGFVRSASPSATTIGACLAEIAELEAASIAAFERLARELAAHGAPVALVARATEARRDEVRHARTVRMLARRFGARTRAPCGQKLAVRRPAAIAIENAVEGCVFETFGAIVATLQAARAEDAGVRAAFESIARDERSHAALAWDVDAWLATRCSADERAAVDRARQNALAQIGAPPPSVDEDARRALGQPTASERDALVRGLRTSFV